MRRIGAHVSTAGGLINALNRAKEIDGNCLQIFAGSPRSWARKLYSIEESCAYLAAAETANFSPVFIHALYLVNLATDNPDLLKKSVDSLIFDLKNGQAINSAGVIVHLGSHQGRGFAVVADQVAGVIKQIISATEDTPFIIENSAGQKGKIGLLPEIGELFTKVNHPRLKLCLDSAHLFAAGYNLRELSGVDSVVNELINLDLLPHLVCLHVNDSKTDLNSRNDQHANLGEGKIGLGGLSQFVNHPDLSHLPMILEVPGEAGMPDARQIAIAKLLAS
ncbi:MAG: deoxyribonuclease IV [Microgenomates group bacterium]